MSATDVELLGRYLRERSEEAFAELVRRHLNLVYSAARRQVRSPELAEEVAQCVFAELARGGHRLTRTTVLPAWLYQVTRRRAVDAIRKEARRQRCEQAALEMNASPPAGSEWSAIEPLLDEAMAALDETGRAAILLRYFENKSLREVGQALSISDDAAQKRVSRAIERLRKFFARRGAGTDAAGLALMISTRAIESAPASLAATVCTAALTGTALPGAAAFTSAKAISAFIPETLAMSKLHTCTIAAALAAATGVAIYQSHQSKLLQEQVHSQQQKIAQFALAEEEWRNEVERVREQVGRLQAGQTELHKLRGEVSALRGASGPPQAAPQENPGQQGEQMSHLDEMEARHLELMAEARLRELTEKLGLSPDQAEAIGQVLLRQTAREKELSQTIFASPADSEALFDAMEAREALEAEVRGWLREEQEEAYRALRLEELTAAARASASAELVQLQNSVRLSPEQQDAVFPALYELARQEKTQREGGTWLTGEGEPAGPRSFREALNSSVQQRLDEVGPHLAPEQLDVYRRFLIMKRDGALMQLEGPRQ